MTNILFVTAYLRARLGYEVIKIKKKFYFQEMGL